MAGIRQAREDVFTRQAGIVGKDGIFRLAGREQIEDELDGKPGSADDGLARQDVGIDHDAIRPRHALMIPGGVTVQLRVFTNVCGTCAGSQLM